MWGDIKMNNDYTTIDAFYDDEDQETEFVQCERCGDTFYITCETAWHAKQHGEELCKYCVSMIGEV